MCPQCGAKYDRDEDVLVLNPQPEEEEKMILAMGRRRAAEPAKSKSKGNKKRKAAAQADEVDAPAAKKKHNGSASPAPLMNPTIAAASRAVVNSLAEEEAKRKAGMSEAVKSLYHPKDGVKKKETFMTMGTFTRVRRGLPSRACPYHSHFACFSVCMTIPKVVSRCCLCCFVVSVCIGIFAPGLSLDDIIISAILYSGSVHTNKCSVRNIMFELEAPNHRLCSIGSTLYLIPQSVYE